MTLEMLERENLSLRYWAQRCVLPAAIILLIMLGLFRLITDNQKDLDHNAVIVGFFSFYYVLVRGGHLLMIRALHFELKRKYETRYREKLSHFSRAAFRRRNLGFTLAQIKRELVQ